MRIELACGLILLSTQLCFGGAVYDVTLNTSGLSGVTGNIAFDFTSGGGPSTNTITITNFATDGTLGATNNTGLVTGTLPGTVTLGDDPVTSFFNEYLTAFTFGSTVSFTLTATTNAPGPSSSPDEFSLFLLDSSGLNSLVTTSDPSLVDSLLLLDVDGTSQGSPAGFTVSNLDSVSSTLIPETPQTGTPEPQSVVLFAMGLIGMLTRVFLSRVQHTTRSTSSSATVSFRRS